LEERIQLARATRETDAGTVDGRRGDHARPAFPALNLGRDTMMLNR
jgi:hypothetical protein